MKITDSSWQVSDDSQEELYIFFVTGILKNNVVWRIYRKVSQSLSWVSLSHGIYLFICLFIVKLMVY